MSEDNKIKPMASPKEDLRRISKNTGAVVGELREFLSSLKGKSPKEMMGAVANSSLWMSLFFSTGIITVLLFALTVIPYVFKQFEDESTTKAESSAEESQSETTTQSSSSTEAATSAPEAPKTKEQTTADALGIGEQKTAAPESNPLDSSSDDLLEGLDDI